MPERLSPAAELAGGHRRGTAGPGRVLALAYGVFALAAGARSAVQLATHFQRAPLGYLLSAVAAASYLTGLLVLVRAESDPRAIGPARVLCGLEFAGVILTGTLSLVRPRLFPDATVWSHYGSGYGYVPAILPLLALWWLHRLAAQPAS